MLWIVKENNFLDCHEKNGERGLQSPFNLVDMKQSVE